NSSGFAGSELGSHAAEAGPSEPVPHDHSHLENPLSTLPTDLLRVDGQRVSLYSTEFTIDPHRVYREMRERFGSLVPVELAPGVPATLVIGYRTALSILNDPERFPVDPRTWEASVAPDCPVLPVFRWRPNASRNSGAAHERLRQATTAAVEAGDLHGLSAVV